MDETHARLLKDAKDEVLSECCRQVDAEDGNDRRVFVVLPVDADSLQATPAHGVAEFGAPGPEFERGMRAVQGPDKRGLPLQPWNWRGREVRGPSKRGPRLRSWN